jgi:uncharacterized protein (DUF2062 family)
MFRRRIKPNISWRLLNIIWPHIGWRRSATYLWHRVARLPGTPYSVAAGLACGVAVSCTPFVGFHLLLGVLIAWLIGANVLASVIGTAAGNPWTFPIIWLWTNELGQLMGVKGTIETVVQSDFPQLFGRSMVALLRFDFGYLYEHALPVVLPMIAGGVPTAILVWIGVYFPVKSVVVAYQNKRNARRGRRHKSTRKKV